MSRMNATAWWPARRAEPEAMGYEAGLIPGTFEPEETLGDTDAMPLESERRERRGHIGVYLLVMLHAVLAFLGWQ